jgi:hypothetical protein
MAVVHKQGVWAVVRELGVANSCRRAGAVRSSALALHYVP